MRFEITHDMDEVKEILAQPQTFSRMVNDAAPRLEDFEITDTDRFIAVMARGEARNKGVFLIFPKQPETAEVHFAFAPKTSGLTHIARQFVQWTWKNTSLNCLVGCVPSYNSLSRKLAAAAGFRPYSAEFGVGKKNGKPFDHVMMEIRRPAQGATA
jgi:RimJ/RimL family protein N-acetyltransferase